jgi:hypothetical protein
MGVEELGMLSPMLVLTDQTCNYAIDLDEPVDASAICAEEEEALIESAPITIQDHHLCIVISQPRRIPRLFST